MFEVKYLWLLFMKKIITSIPIFFFLMSSFLLSQDKDLGVGVILGEPSGLSVKYWTSESNAIDFAVGYSFMGLGNGLAIHADYLYHVNDLIKSEYNLPVYYGFGVGLSFPDNENTVFGARGVFGVLWYPENLPVDLFVEIAPSFRLLPSTALDFGFGIGGRYYIEF